MLRKARYCHSISILNINLRHLTEGQIIIEYYVININGAHATSSFKSFMFRLFDLDVVYLTLFYLYCKRGCQSI